MLCLLSQRVFVQLGVIWSAVAYLTQNALVHRLEAFIRDEECLVEGVSEAV